MQNNKDQQTLKSFDKLDTKTFQDNVIDKNEYEFLSNMFTTYVDETEKKESFL